MYIQAHAMSGWIVSNYLKLNARERFFSMLAASLLDLDGLGIIVSPDLYDTYHHVLGHNICFGIIVAGILTVFSMHKLKCFFLYLALFHLHILMDLVGSGELWTISYLWPFSKFELYFEHNWALFSWQNMVANFALLGWTIALIFTHKRTPLEYVTPKLDKKWTSAINDYFSKAEPTSASD